MDPADIKYGISLEFWSSNDMVIQVGPLQITSIGKDWSDWGSFEILWSDHWYFYCHFLQDCDPYKGETFITGEPHWVLYNMRKRRDIWCSTRETTKLRNWWNGVVNRLRGS